MLKTNKKFTKEVYALVGDEYTFLESYVNSRTKLAVVHNTCGHKYEVRPDKFLNTGRRCPACNLREKTWTNEMFVTRVKEEVGDEYTFLGSYVNSYTKLDVVHNTCGYRYGVTPANFLNQGSRCPACRVGNKWTNEMFVTRVKEEVGDEYTFLEPYGGARTKLAVVHNTCGHRYVVKPSAFLYVGSRCPSCSHKMKGVMFVTKVKEEVGGEYTFLEPYVSNDTKLAVVHNTCGHKYEVTPANFLNQGSRCPACRVGNKWTNEMFVTRVKEEVGDEYTFLGSYVNSRTKLAVVHNKCGHRYSVRPDDFLNKGHRCPACNLREKTWTNEMFVTRVKEEVGDEYTFIEPYVNSKTDLTVIHNTCGHRYVVKPSAFLYVGNRCPACNESKGERKIADYLDKMGILFEREKTFSDLKVINSLRYDFAVYNKGELITLIEYDGEQHFVAVDFFGGEEQLLKTQLHDQIKNEYVKENNISLLRIPYNDYDNIEEILDRWLSDHFRSKVYIDIY